MLCYAIFILLYYNCYIILFKQKGKIVGKDMEQNHLSVKRIALISTDSYELEGVIRKQQNQCTIRLHALLHGLKVKSFQISSQQICLKLSIPNESPTIIRILSDKKRCQILELCGIITIRPSSRQQLTTIEKPVILHLKQIPVDLTQIIEAIKNIQKLFSQNNKYLNRQPEKSKTEQFQEDQMLQGIQKTYKIVDKDFIVKIRIYEDEHIKVYVHSKHQNQFRCFSKQIRSNQVKQNKKQNNFQKLCGWLLFSKLDVSIKDDYAIIRSKNLINNQSEVLWLKKQQSSQFDKVKFIFNQELHGLKSIIQQQLKAIWNKFNSFDQSITGNQNQLNILTAIRQQSQNSQANFYNIKMETHQEPSTKNIGKQKNILYSQNEKQIKKNSQFYQKGFYEGELKNDQRNGNGIYYYSTGSKYDGNWMDNERNGFGIFYYINGDIYEGQWKNDVRNGQGSYILKSGKKLKQNYYNGELI